MLATVRYGELGGMDEREWEAIDTAKRGQALLLAGVPDREGDSPNDYEALDWDALPIDAQDKLRLLPDSWEDIDPYED
jgi:hypothetical protein